MIFFSPVPPSSLCCLHAATVSHEQLSPFQPWSRRTGRNSTDWYRCLRKGNRTCLPAASVRWTSLWGIFLFLLSTKGSNAMAPCAWTKQWISPRLLLTVNWGDPPSRWRWESRSHRMKTTVCRRLHEESVPNRRTLMVNISYKILWQGDIECNSIARREHVYVRL